MALYDPPERHFAPAPEPRPNAADKANIALLAEKNGIDPSRIQCIGGPYSDWLGWYDMPPAVAFTGNRAERRRALAEWRRGRT